MARFINKPAKATMGAVPDWTGLAPIAFEVARERHKVVEVMDCFRAIWEPWWEDPQALSRGPVEVDLWRVRTAKGGVYELAQWVEDKSRFFCYKCYD